MFLLTPFALAGTLSPHDRGVVWTEGDNAVLFDPARHRLVAAGAAGSLSDVDGADTEGPRWPYKGAGVVVARSGKVEVVVRRGEMLVFNNGLRTARSWLPDHWNLDEATFRVFGTSGAAVYDGELLFLGRDRQPLLIQADVETFVRSGTRGLLFEERPGVWYDPGRAEIRPLDPIEITHVRSHSAGASGLHDGRPIVWDSSGTIVYLGVDVVEEARVSPDGTLLAKRSPEDVLDLVDVPTGEILFSNAVCAGTPWPHDDRSVSVDCGDRLVFAQFGKTVDVQRPAGVLRHLTLQEGHLRVVMGGEGMGTVYEAPLDGGGLRLADHGLLSGEVKGYRYGRPHPLVVTEVDGRPVERATARAYEDMVAAAAKEGVVLRVASGFRTFAEQQALYDCYLSGDCNNGNLAARPGHSRHQSGHALDLNTHVEAVNDWLVANAATFGFRATVRSEPWHWEYSGVADPTAVPVDLLPVAEPAAIVPLDLPFPVRFKR